MCSGVEQSGPKASVWEVGYFSRPRKGRVVSKGAGLLFTPRENRPGEPGRVELGRNTSAKANLRQLHVAERSMSIGCNVADKHHNRSPRPRSWPAPCYMLGLLGPSQDVTSHPPSQDLQPGLVISDASIFWGPSLALLKGI